MTSRVLLGCFLAVLLLPDSIDATCVSGVVSSDYCKKDSSIRCQSQVKHVRFNPPFRKTPTVMVAISHLDIWNGQNTRATTYASGLSPHGFNVNIKTWSNTHMYRVEVNWMACL
ncbi:uncharacterized protein LOC106176159 [Lingula anatina]|uniref:Uncharacterized protein LOC106176159 n=1 Tax=Lingula anatina TaxID=7574 RepID=A0A1S3JU60_LINAN|nr:uncharacterized protein LOC106176159 [Lingula anatina]|eukprot:XP_013413867.1 uncharacterized protein LOC106176159 [Lingula anatina]